MSTVGESFVARLKSLLGELARIAQTRLELLTIELELEKRRLARELLLAALCLISAWLAGLTLVIWAALALPPRARLLVLAVLFAVFLLAGVGAWIALRRSLRRDPLFSRLIAQLRLDRASLDRPP
ncbi:MAG TPA: phage holin family protein [Steroidobacteraceae bacterium]|nr:phage holin family protein [Steroidobacteraceae bacterium]